VKINKVNVYKVSLPFISEFSISRLKGLSSNIIVVEVIADQGEIKGYGEGVPVEFITGETPQSAAKNVRLFAQKDFFPWELNDVSQVWDFVDGLPNGKRHNAAICASEMALLDVLGKRQNQSIIKYFPHEFFTPKINYGVQIPLAHKQRIIEICKMSREMKINNLRVKMGKDFKQNKEAIEIVNLVFGDDCDLRIDPNGAWDRYLAFKHIPLIKKCNVKIVEEPMIKDNPDFVEFAKIMQANGVILMACESAPTLNDVERIIREGYYQMINVKLSRNGGFRRSLRIIECIRNSGLSFQIGCAIGESGILSAAGRALGLLCRDALYYDGSYDAFLLKENTTLENVSFGPAGEAGLLDGPGLGVKINSQALELLSTDFASITRQ